ncbi:MAG: OmpA family protein [Endozoicomonadaceae bacterium]|nr:OmpA family protein [Endozoicomonadaceae bacterium]
MIQRKFRLRPLGLLALTIIISGCAATHSNNTRMPTCFTADDADGAAIGTMNNDIDCATVNDNDISKNRKASHHTTQSIVSQARVTFDLDSSKLDNYDKKSLDKIADIATLNTTIHITGHTCNLGPSAHNQNVSIKRANAVRNYLISKGVKSSITTEGKGANSPIASNRTDKGRIKNRRANIKVSRITTIKNKVKNRRKQVEKVEKVEKQQRTHHQKKPRQKGNNNYLNPFLIYHH